ELENAILRALVLAGRGGALGEQHFDPLAAEAPPAELDGLEDTGAETLRQTLARVEASVVRAARHRHARHRSETARRPGLTPGRALQEDEAFPSPVAGQTGKPLRYARVVLWSSLAFGSQRESCLLACRSGERANEGNLRLGSLPGRACPRTRGGGPRSRERGR